MSAPVAVTGAPVRLTLQQRAEDAAIAHAEKIERDRQLYVAERRRADTAFLRELLATVLFVTADDDVDEHYDAETGRVTAVVDGIRFGLGKYPHDETWRPSRLAVLMPACPGCDAESRTIVEDLVELGVALAKSDEPPLRLCEACREEAEEEVAQLAGVVGDAAQGRSSAPPNEHVAFLRLKELAASRSRVLEPSAEEAAAYRAAADEMERLIHQRDALATEVERLDPV